jgi:hypothetical protein
MRRSSLTTAPLLRQATYADVVGDEVPINVLPSTDSSDTDFDFCQVLMHGSFGLLQ